MAQQHQTNCPSDETLAAYIEGRLAADHHASVTEHLGRCSTCYRVFAEVAKEEVTESWRRRILFYGTVAAAVVLLVLGSRLILDRSLPSVSERSRGTAAYWIQKYGILSPVEDPLVFRGRRVFERIVQVVEQAKPGQPHLVFIRAAETPSALALRDGNILLTSGGLRICYRGVSADQGDARLAFVLGHELLHRKNQHFLHAAAFAAVEGEGLTPKASAEEELQADAYGLIYATMAGYDPRAVLQPTTSFIQEWVSQIPQKFVYEDRSHPGPKERVSFLHSYLENVVRNIDYFHFGVRLYQLGRYEEAVLFLNHFAEKFPSREVWNNAGLCHYQLALQALATCDSGLVEQFYPATFLESQTLAGQFRAFTATPCLEKEAFREQIRMAEDSFRKAAEMDSTYLPARVNLSSVHLMTRQYALAHELIDEALKVNPNDSAALNNLALALSLSDPAQTERSLSILKGVLRANPAFAPALYNEATLQFKRGLTAEARESWSHYLQSESSGLYANAARRQLHLKETATKEIPATMSSPVPLGEINTIASKMLAKMQKVSFSLKDMHGAFYEDDTIKVLVLDDVVEVVETISPLQQVTFGAPLRTIFTPSGKVQVYRNLAVDIREGTVHTILYFE